MLHTRRALHAAVFLPPVVGRVEQHRWRHDVHALVVEGRGLRQVERLVHKLQLDQLHLQVEPAAPLRPRLHQRLLQHRQHHRPRPLDRRAVVDTAGWRW